MSDEGNGQRSGAYPSNIDQFKAKSPFQQESLNKRDHGNAELHYIGEALPVPSVINPVGSSGNVGLSPIPAREDHVHASAAGTIALTNGCCAKYNASINVPHDTYVKYTVNAFSGYADAGWAISNGSVKVPKTGRYLFRAQVDFGVDNLASSGGRLLINFTVDGTYYSAGFCGINVPASEYPAAYEAIYIANVNANQLIGFDVYQSTGAALDTEPNYCFLFIEQIGGITGPKGDKGDIGDTGATGQAEGWYSAPGIPGGGVASPGDWYLDTTSGDVYEKTGVSSWTLRANIRGPQGIQGQQGPAGASEGILVGAIVLYGGTTVPTKYLLCDGSAVLRSSYPDLFSAISTSWGAGDGTNTFNLPNFTNFFPRGATTPGGTGGFADSPIVNHTHVVDPHTHTMAHNHDINQATTATAGGARSMGAGGTVQTALQTTASSAANTGGASASVTQNPTAGVSGTGRNIPPYKDVPYIIRALP